MVILLAATLLCTACNTTPGWTKSGTGNDSVIQKIKDLNDLAARLNPDSTNVAITAAHEAYLLALREDNLHWQGKSMLNLSEGYLYNDSYDQAMQYGSKALDLFQALNDSANYIKTIQMIGWIFYDTENPSLALNYHRQAYEWQVKHGTPDQIANSLNALGLVHQMIGNNDSAKYFFLQTIDLSRINHLQSLTSAALNNTGICENALGNYNEAIQYFKEARKLKDSAGGDLAIAEIENQMAFSFLQKGDFQKTDSLLTDARVRINKATSNTKKEKLADNLGIYAQLYRQENNFKMAYESLKELNEVESEISSRNKTNVVTAQYLKSETQKREDKINELKAQRELRVFQRNALGIFIILLIIIGFLWFSRLKHKRNREKELEKWKEGMLKKDLETSRKEKVDLNEKLEYKNTSLKNYALYISHTNELQRNFVKELTALASRTEIRKETEAEFNKLIRHFLHNIEQNKEKQGFNISFEEANSDFFFNLLQKVPDLTENEQRLCAQIRLNLSSKEIASFNNISVKSVEMARYRLRKHFNLSSKDDLTTFIQSF